MNLLDTFHARVAEHPDRVAIIDPRDRAITYAALAERAGALAAAWEQSGLRAGDRVLLALGFSADLYAALAALWRIGAVAVLPEPALGLKGIDVAVDSAAPRAILLGGRYRLLPCFVSSLRGIALRLSMRPARGAPPPVADLQADAPALISFTTGSTGRPKGIVRSHGFMAAQERAVAPLIGTGGHHEIDLVGFPVFVIANLGQGITSVLPDWSLRRTDTVKGEEIALRIQRHHVTRLLLNPALVERLVEVNVAAPVHSVFTGGGPVYPDLFARVRAARGDIRMVAVYGSTEAEPIAEVEAADIGADDFAAMQGGEGILAGRPVDAVRVRIVDDEIQVTGEHVVKTYLDPARDAETKQRDDDGTLWHRTGDAGRFDTTGRLWLLGRMDGRIEGRFPFSIEAAARYWPGVRRAALAASRGRAVLAIEGDRAFASEWKRCASAIGIADTVFMPRIPMDRRHGSKVDRARLEILLEQRSG
jgi:acyl-CoA synthetase (AMP-forming)/AMP-acid ligase II